MPVLYAMMFSASPVGSWPMWAGDPSHQAVQPMEGAMVGPPTIKWDFVTGGDVEWQFSAVEDVDRDGHPEVIFGSADHKIYCVDGATGSQEWAFTTLSVVESSPAVADADGDGSLEVVVGSGDGKVYCLSGGNGTQEWSFSTLGQIMSSPAVADADGDGDMEVVIGSGDHEVYCINGSTGAQEWAFATGDMVLSSPAVANVVGDARPEVILGSNDSVVYCLAGTDGSEIWSFATNNSVWSSPVVADVDRDGQLEILVGSDDYRLYCLNAATGTQEWAFATGDMVRSAPSVADVDGDGVLEVVFGSWDNRIYCLSGPDGQVEWTHTTPGHVHGPGSLVDVDGDGMLEFIASQNHGGQSSVVDTLYCLNAEDGSLAWQIGLAPDVHTPFAADIDGDGCVEIITGTRADHTLHALEDPGNSASCGALYFGIDENPSSANDVQLRAMGMNLYLFMPTRAEVSLVLYDAAGRAVKTVFQGLLEPGGHDFAPGVGKTGVYSAVLRHKGATLTAKLVVR